MIAISSTAVVAIACILARVAVVGTIIWSCTKVLPLAWVVVAAALPVIVSWRAIIDYRWIGTFTTAASGT